MRSVFREPHSMTVPCRHRSGSVTGILNYLTLSCLHFYGSVCFKQLSVQYLCHSQAIKFVLAKDSEDYLIPLSQRDGIVTCLSICVALTFPKGQASFWSETFYKMYSFSPFGHHRLMVKYGIAFWTIFYLAHSELTNMKSIVSTYT